MSDETGITPAAIPPPPEGWWEQVPVLRELYRLLSSTDPVNWELARQVGVALATYDEPDLDAADDTARELESMTRAAEMASTEFSGLVADEPAGVLVTGRGRWVEENVAVFKTVMEPLARKVSGGSSAAQLPEPVATLMRQTSAIMLGLQTGMVLGYLGRHVLGQYELALPHPAGGRLLYVATNMQAVAHDWELDRREFGYWIALHEVTHHLTFGRAWTRRYFHSQLATLIDSLDFDPERMQSMFGDFDLFQPDRLAEVLGDPESLIRAAWTPLGRHAMAKLQAFMTLTEGYATFVMDAVGAQVLQHHARMQEVMNRRRNEVSPGEVLLERLLGLELKRKQYEEGAKFCRYVAGMRDVGALNRVWDNPDMLPTLEELAEPDGWIERALDG